MTKGRGFVAIVKDKEGTEELKKVVAKRLKASRLAAGMKLDQAAVAIGHANVTQLSLAESGERIPPHLSLVKLADLYCVPLDFIYGRNDDPIADPVESNQGVIVRSVTASIKTCFDQFCKAISEHSSVAIAGQRQDRKDLVRIGNTVTEALAALNRMKLLNPEFEEDWRGGATLEAAIQRISDIAQNVHGRIEHERRLVAAIDKKLPTQTIDEGVVQFLLDLGVN